MFRYIESIHQTSGSGARPALELAILGLLVGKDLHGYELRRRLSQTLGPVGRLSFGTLYPALTRMEKAGSVEVVKVTESRTGLTTARGRKVYRLTDPGRKLFSRLLDQPTTSDDDRSFALRIAFARHLSVEARIRLLQRRREQLIVRLEDMRTNLDGAAHDGSMTDNDYGHMLMVHTIDMTEQDLGWIDKLITAESIAASSIAASSIAARETAASKSPAKSRSTDRNKPDKNKKVNQT